MRDIKWGILGCGNVTEVKSGPAYINTSGFEVVAVMRRNEEKAKDYANRHGIKIYYSNADDLINDENVDAIYIATPPDSHKYYALKVAHAGKICCIEKPMTPSYAESLEIFNAFKSKDIPLFIAYYRRSLPRFKQIKSWLDSDAIGDIRHINWQFTKPASDLDKSGEYNWRTDLNIAPGGYFDDLASHGLDLFNYLIGDIIEAKGISLNQQNYYSAKDAFSSCWLHGNGATGAAFWNFGAHKHFDEVVIYGNRGEISFSIFHNNPIKIESINYRESIFIENPKHIQQFHVEAMRDMLIHKNMQHPSMGASGLHANWVMDKILGII
ncbi:Gfo/Idh/MocA family protein [Gaetbulibacter saemankumensis]|uniref:Gfo/Idh/MocA family protein n=1 Tax=Gaetbulibacter saemankumensis TaxID=311208 RepID=UPI0004049381|nr:Gfo/Idh/MocA family oxidoreductase [Gaetbulibacter saemankumensis]